MSRYLEDPLDVGRTADLVMGIDRASGPDRTITHTYNALTGESNVIGCVTHTYNATTGESSVSESRLTMDEVMAVLEGMRAADPRIGPSYIPRLPPPPLPQVVDVIDQSYSDYAKFQGLKVRPIQFPQIPRLVYHFDAEQVSRETEAVRSRMCNHNVAAPMGCLDCARDQLWIVF